MSIRTRRESPRAERRPSAGHQEARAGRGLADPQLGVERVGQLLGKWQAQELRVARGLPACRGLGAEQLEDIYQETALALLRRPYGSEEHLRNALRTGLQHRALNVHRDERRRRQILTQSAPSLHRVAEVQAHQSAPEAVAVVREDRLIVSEFLTELNPTEQRVFWLLAEGMQYRAIASALGIDINTARNASRACERKRERFQLLYDTGRLCGFRGNTIKALQRGEATSDELAERAFAHLDGCAHCRTEHNTNAKRLRRSFQDQAAALLPLTFTQPHGWLARLALRAKSLHNLLAGWVPGAQEAIGERTPALASAGTALKALPRIAAAALLAGGALIGAKHALAPGHTRPQPQPSIARKQPTASAVRSESTAAGPVRPATGGTKRDRSSRRRTPRSATGYPFGPGHVVSYPPPQPVDRAHLHQHEPGGFADLGVPTQPKATTTPTTPQQIGIPSGGGEFSP